MLGYIYNVEVGILYHACVPNTESEICLLNRCDMLSNRNAFMYVYKYIVDNNILYGTDWYNFIHYLSEAIVLYSPGEALATKICNSLLRKEWNQDEERIFKLLMPSVTAISPFIATTQYSHFAPHLVPTDIHELTKACNINNIEEVKHRLLHTDYIHLSLYTALISPIDNKECIELILPFVDGNEGNKFIAYAYINNKLPNYRILDYEDDITMRAIISHFTGDINLEGSTSNNSLFYIAHKFNFSTSLLYECVKHQHRDMIKSRPKQIAHKIDAIVNHIDNNPVSPCDCTFCQQLDDM